MWLTLVVMVAEIAGGWIFNSMALLADGWHMSSHALAMGLAVFAYKAARRYAKDRRFAFGTWKIEILGGFSSALMLVGVAALMFFQSVERLVTPLPIGYDQAIGTAVLGLAVNLVSAFLLKDDGHHHHHHHHGHHHHHHGHHHHHHAHSHGHLHASDHHADAHAHAHAHDHDHDHGHADLNLRAAYLHVLTDAATSVLAIIALLGGKYWGASWLDPLMGIVGAVVVAIWAKGLLTDCARVLLDAEMDDPVVARVRRLLGAAPVPVQVNDLHIWRVSHQKYACIMSVSGPAGGASSADEPLSAALVHRWLAAEKRIVHLTVEVMQ